MSTNDAKDNIYDELRGYFPPEYDLTPDELEKEIEIENKKREIALGMMKTHLTKDITDEDPKISEDGTAIESSEKNEPATPAAFERTDLEPAPLEDGIPPHHGRIIETSPTGDAAGNDNYYVDFSELDAFLGLNGEEVSLDTAISESPDEENITAELIENTLAEELEDSLFSDGEVELSSLDYSSLTNEFPVIDMPDISKLNEITEDDIMIDEEEEITEKEEDEDISEYLSAYEADSETEPADKEDSGRKAVNWVFDFLEIFAVCITCIIIVFASLFRLTQVSGDSMQNTLFDKEYLVVSDFMYTPKVGDIVVLQNTALTHEQLKGPLVKRVIATGGQKVSISAEGIVKITDTDGSQRYLPQSYVKPEPYTDGMGEYVVPEGYIFVMGDNRNHSTDSRSSLVGVVDERCVFGKAVMRILPFDKFTVFENPYEE